MDHSLCVQSFNLFNDSLELSSQFQRSLLCSATLLLSAQTAMLVLLIDALRPTGTAVAFIVGRREEACEPLSSIAFVAEIFDGCTSMC